MAKKNSSPAPAKPPVAIKAPAQPAAPAQVPAKGGTLEAKPTAHAPKAATHEDIARAAFLRWQTHGGDAESNWLAAERELTAKR